MVKPAKGTTTLAFIFKGGVMVVVDSRASMPFAHYCLYVKQCEEVLELLINFFYYDHPLVNGSCDLVAYPVTLSNDLIRDMEDLIIFMIEFFLVQVNLYLTGLSIKCLLVLKISTFYKISSVAYSSLYLCNMLYLFKSMVLSSMSL